MDRIQAALINPQQAYQWWLSAWQTIKPLLIAGHRLHVEVRQEKRSDPQNARLHAMLQQIASSVEWAGKKRDVETWKRLLTASWLRARGEHIEMLPALDGNGVDIVFRRTSSLTSAECSELMDFIEAWSASETLS